MRWSVDAGLHEGRPFLGVLEDPATGWRMFYWMWLDPSFRYWGYRSFAYDGEWCSFGCWFFNFNWRW